jgi:hypothetical protein
MAELRNLVGLRLGQTSVAVLQLKVLLQGNIRRKGLPRMRSAAPHAAVDVGLVSQPGRPARVQGVGVGAVFVCAHVGLNIAEYVLPDRREFSFLWSPRTPSRSTHLQDLPIAWRAGQTTQQYGHWNSVCSGLVVGARGSSTAAPSEPYAVEVDVYDATESVSVPSSRFSLYVDTSVPEKVVLAANVDAAGGSNGPG